MTPVTAELRSRYVSATFRDDCADFPTRGVNRDAHFLRVKELVQFGNQSPDRGLFGLLIPVRMLRKGLVLHAVRWLCQHLQVASLDARAGVMLAMDFDRLGENVGNARRGLRRGRWLLGGAVEVFHQLVGNADASVLDSEGSDRATPAERPALASEPTIGVAERDLTPGLTPSAGVAGVHPDPSSVIDPGELLSARNAREARTEGIATGLVLLDGREPKGLVEVEFARRAIGGGVRSHANHPLRSGQHPKRGKGTPRFGCMRWATTLRIDVTTR